LFSAEWTSLEIAKLFVAVLTPVLIVGLGYVINRSLNRLQQTQWASQRFMERRLSLYDEMAPLFNDLYCFFNCVGGFRSITPPMAVTLKRQLDRTFFVHEFLFSVDFRLAYHAYMDAAFLAGTKDARDAKLKASRHRQQQERGETWREEWARAFSDADATPVTEINRTYERLMKAFASELGAPSG
jgi:hypothetical protein